MINHMPKNLSCLKGNALILLKNRQLITRSTLILSEFQSEAVSPISLAIFSANSAALLHDCVTIWKQ